MLICVGILEMLSDDIANILAGGINVERVARNLTNIRSNFILPEDLALRAIALDEKASVPPDFLGQIEEAFEILATPNGEDFEGSLIMSLQEMVLALGELRNLDGTDIQAALEGKFSWVKKQEYI